MTATAFARAAADAHEAFEAIMNGDEITVRLRKERPDWVKDTLFECLPDYGDSTNLICDISRDALGILTEYADEREAEGGVNEFGDSAADDYYTDLVAWMSMNPTDHGTWVNDAMSNFGETDSIWTVIGMGQALQAEYIYRKWAAACAKAAQWDQ